MAHFSFRLQPLLELRLATRDERREDLAKAYHADRLLVEQLDRVRAELSEPQATARQAARPGTVSVDHLLNTHRYELLLGAQCGQITRQREDVQKEIQRRREALIEADREVKILERLRESKQSEFQFQEARVETRELDEVASIRAARQKEAAP